MTTGPSSWRPVLRPGTRVLRRGADSLQVGTRPGVVVRDRPGLRQLLALVDGRRSIADLTRSLRGRADFDVATTVMELVALGALLPHPPAAPTPPLVELVVADRRARGLAEAVDVVGRGLGWRHGMSHRAVLVVVSCGEPPRRPLELARELGRSTLPVVLDEDRVRVGPFAIPARTPCLECADRERARWDHAWPALLTQIDSATGLPSPPAAPVVAQWAAAATVGADLVRFASGTTPRTAGAVVQVGADPLDVVPTPVAFHPDCPCRLLPAA